jgi:hypothetical protein
MPTPIESCIPLIKKLTHRYGSFDAVSANYLYMSIAALILQDRQKDFTLGELRSVSKQINPNMRNNAFTQNFRTLLEMGAYIQSAGGKYTVNPDYISGMQIEVPSRDKAIEIELKAKLMMMRPGLLYLAAVFIEGYPAFSITRLRNYQSGKEKIEISSKIQGKVDELERLLINSGVEIPFLEHGNEPSQIVKLFHKAGIKLPHECSKCYNLGDKCEGEKGICHFYISREGREAQRRPLERLAAKLIEKPTEQAIEIETKKEVTERTEEKLAIDREDIEKKRIEWTEKTLKNIQTRLKAPDEIYDRASQILKHLEERAFDYVQRTVNLADILMFLSAIDVDKRNFIRSLGIPSKIQLSHSLQELTNVLHETDFSLHHGCEDCFSYERKKCFGHGEPKERALWEICIDYKYAISTSSKPSTAEGKNAALKILFKFLNEFIFPRSDQGFTIKDLEELEAEKLAVSKKYGSTKVFKITGNGIKEFGKRKDM